MYFHGLTYYNDVKKITKELFKICAENNFDFIDKKQIITEIEQYQYRNNFYYNGFLLDLYAYILMLYNYMRNSYDDDYADWEPLEEVCNIIAHTFPGIISVILDDNFTFPTLGECFRRFTDYKLDHIKIENCLAKIKDTIKELT